MFPNILTKTGGLRPWSSDLGSLRPGAWIAAHPEHRLIEALWLRVTESQRRALPGTRP
jgi:hypothetical protein